MLSRFYSSFIHSTVLRGTTCSSVFVLPRLLSSCLLIYSSQISHTFFCSISSEAGCMQNCWEVPSDNETLLLIVNLPSQIYLWPLDDIHAALEAIILPFAWVLPFVIDTTATIPLHWVQMPPLKRADFGGQLPLGHGTLNVMQAKEIWNQPWLNKTVSSECLWGGYPLDQSTHSQMVCFVCMLEKKNKVCTSKCQRQESASY